MRRLLCTGHLRPDPTPDTPPGYWRLDRHSTSGTDTIIARPPRSVWRLLAVADACLERLRALGLCSTS